MNENFRLHTGLKLFNRYVFMNDIITKLIDIIQLTKVLKNNLKKRKAL